MKNYVVIGGSSGIGKALVHQLSTDSNNVYATYLNSSPEKLNELEHYYKLDVTSENIDFTFLPDHIDGLIYCPGSINLMPFKRISPANFTADFELQVNGAIKVIQACINRLKKATNPSIILFSTVAVQLGFKYHTQVAVSKGAIEGLTRSLASEFAPRIRVNAIAPSLTNTPLAQNMLNSDEKKMANAERHPLKKIGTPKNIADLASFLLSEKSSWMTGQIIHLDGGMSSIK